MSRPVHTTARMRARSLRELRELAHRPLNVSLEELPDGTHAAGWDIEEYCQPLPDEPPGPPIDGGPFETANVLMDRYAMADPSIVRAAFDPTAPLPGRDMLLEGRFLGLRFRMGTRVGEVADRERTLAGRPVRIRGWNYRTLEGHLERGQMDWEVWKWLDTGAVEFRMHLVSQPAPVANPIVAFGFRLFGRWMQSRFVRTARTRMNRMVAAGCGVEPTGRDCGHSLTGRATVMVRQPPRRG